MTMLSSFLWFPGAIDCEVRKQTIAATHDANFGNQTSSSNLLIE